MIDNVQPIRDGIEPTLDIERELIEYAIDKIRRYCEEHGPPASIALVLIGEARGDAKSQAYSWSPGDDNSSRLHTCSVASAMLMDRAIGR